MSRRSRRWWAIALTALVLVAGVVVAIVASQRLGSGDVEGELGGYQLVDDETLSVTIKVTRADPSRPVVCIVRARADRRQRDRPPGGAGAAVVAGHGAP